MVVLLANVKSAIGKFGMIYAIGHLFGLKAAIYDNPYENEPSDTLLDGFTLIHTEEISYEAEFTNSEDISALFMMTPYAYRTGRAERERAFSLERVRTQIEFILLVYEKL